MLAWPYPLAWALSWACFPFFCQVLMKILNKHNGVDPLKFTTNTNDAVFVIDLQAQSKPHLFSPHNFTITVLPYLASRRESCPGKGKHHFCSLCKAHCPTVEELTKNKSHQPHILIYLFFMFLCLCLQSASLSPHFSRIWSYTDWFQLCCSFPQVSPSPSSTGATFPGGWVCSNLQSWTCFGNELSSVTLFFVQYYWVTWELQMYLIIGTVEMIAKKPEALTFPWVVISQAGGGKETWFMNIH